MIDESQPFSAGQKPIDEIQLEIEISPSSVLYQFSGSHQTTFHIDQTSFASFKLSLPSVLPPLRFSRQVPIFDMASGAGPSGMTRGLGSGSGTNPTAPGATSQRRPEGGPGSGSDSGVSGVTPGPNFTNAQRQELMDIVAAALRMHRGGVDSPGPNPISSPGLGAGPDSNEIKTWISEEIGFFDSDGEMLEGSISTIERHVFYRDIYVFVDRLKDMAPLRGEDKLRIVIPQCLRGSAIVWHTTELSDMKKTYLRDVTVAQ